MLAMPFHNSNSFLNLKSRPLKLRPEKCAFKECSYSASHMQIDSPSGDDPALVEHRLNPNTRNVIFSDTAIHLIYGQLDIISLISSAEYYRVKDL